MYYSNKFKIEDINEFIEGASKGLLSPSGIGIGIGNGLGKGKEPKIKVEILIPEFEEFLKYALEKEPFINEKALKLKYDAWVVNGWKNGNGNPIKNWKSNLLNTIPYIQKNNQNVRTEKNNGNTEDFDNGFFDHLKK